MTFSVDAKRNVVTNYGPRTTNSALGGKVDSRDNIHKAEWIFNYDNLPTYGATNIQLSIPAYAKILRSYFEVITAFTSTSTTTDLDVGLYTSAGVAIDADGLHTAAQLTQTAIATRGLFYLGAGALIGTSIGATAGELVVTPNVADLTAGRGRVIVEYVLEGV